VQFIDMVNLWTQVVVAEADPLRSAFELLRDGFAPGNRGKGTL
jgi:hypothetical protein